MNRFLIIIGLIFGIEGFCVAATWFVRPGVFTTMDAVGHPIPTIGVYGSQTGTNYANAWNGMTSIVWGASGVSSNDTLYVCGTHVFKMITAWGNLQGVDLIGSSYVTIRMDWPGDTGTVFGGHLRFIDPNSDFSGPDANGVYHQTGFSGVFGIYGAHITRLKKRSTITWTDGLGGQFLLDGTNYVQFPDGSVPTTNTVAREDYGWTFNLNNQSNITFQSCNFIDAGFYQGVFRRATPVSPFTTAPTHITFANCTFFDSEPFYLFPGEDCFSFLNCEFGRCGSAIYSLLNRQTRAPNNITVSNCYFHDLNTLEYPDVDGHAVGIQGGDFHLVTHNTTSNTGPAILLWTGNVDMKSNTISYNFVMNTHINSQGISDGISVSGDNSLAVAGLRTGNKIYGNIICNCDVGSGLGYQGLGISCNSPDYIEIYNNTIYGGNIGIDIEVAIANCPVNAKVVNNIILQPLSKYYYIVGAVAPANRLVDYNLFYSTVTLSNQFTIYPITAHDQHSIFENPFLMSAIPTTATDFQLKQGSHAIGTGTPIGLFSDFSGTPIPSDRAPDIGAYEFVSPRALTPPSTLRIIPPK